MKTMMQWCAALLLVSGLAQAADSKKPEAGQAAPEFRLQDQNAQWHTLADHRGKWVVLYFYPKDGTPGCTTQACNFRDQVFRLKNAGADVIGVSLDDVKSHEEFAKKHQLPFTLLADTDGKTADAYGVLGSMIGFKYAKRTTFLIAPDGVIAQRYDDVDPKENAAQVLAEIERRKAAKPSA